MLLVLWRTVFSNSSYCWITCIFLQREQRPVSHIIDLCKESVMGPYLSLSEWLMTAADRSSSHPQVLFFSRFTTQLDANPWWIYFQSVLVNHVLSNSNVICVVCLDMTKYWHQMDSYQIFSTDIYFLFALIKQHSWSKVHYSTHTENSWTVKENYDPFL